MKNIVEPDSRKKENAWARLLSGFGSARAERAEEQAQSGVEKNSHAEGGESPFSQGAYVGEFFETDPLLRIMAEKREKAEVLGIVEKSSAEREQAKLP